jgi:hypothetical protein
VMGTAPAVVSRHAMAGGSGVSPRFRQDVRS